METLLPDLPPNSPERVEVINKIPKGPAQPGLAVYVASDVEWTPNEVKFLIGHLWRYNEGHRVYHSLHPLNNVLADKQQHVHRLTAVEQDLLIDYGYNLIHQLPGMGYVFGLCTLATRHHVTPGLALLVQQLILHINADIRTAQRRGWPLQDERISYMLRDSIRSFIYRQTAARAPMTEVSAKLDNTKFGIAFSLWPLVNDEYVLAWDPADPTIFKVSASLMTMIEHAQLIWPSTWSVAKGTVPGFEVFQFDNRLVMVHDGQQSWTSGLKSL